MYLLGGEPVLQLPSANSAINQGSWRWLAYFIHKAHEMRQVETPSVK